MNDEFFQFYSRQAFWLFLIVVPLFVFDLYKLHLIKFPLSSSKIFSQNKKSWRQVLEFLPPLFRFLALSLVVIALARPQWGHEYTEVESEGIDIILTLDTSESMRALDMELNGKESDRLEVVKSVVDEFIRGRQFDRIGMVVFGEHAYTQCPLTLDYEVLRGYLDMIEIGIAGDATAIGNALATSVKRLEKSEAKSKIIVLLTDGRSNAGQVSPKVAAELAKEKGIKVYTISIGTKGPVPYPQQGFFGMQKGYVNLDTDEDTLKEISEITGARFFQAGTTEALSEIYKSIDKMEKTKVEMNKFSEYKEMYFNYLMAAVLFLLLAWVLQHTFFLRLP